MMKVDVDESVDVAWRAYEHRLTAELVELRLGETLQVDAAAGGGRPHVIVIKRRPRTISATAAETRTFRVGAEADVATWVLGVLRGTYGVIHPAFLGRVAHRETPEVEPLPVAVSPEQLDDLVDRALRAVTSAPIARDRDGDVPVVGDHGVAYVRVRRDQPVVEVFALLEPLDDDASAARALWHANRQNLAHPTATFVLMRGWLVGRVSVWCHPFVASTVVHAVDEVMAMLESYEVSTPRGSNAAESAAPADAGGEEEPADDGLAPELLTIIQLDVAEPGSVSPELAARIFGYDRDKLLAGIRTSEAQMLEWLSSVDEARTRDEDEAEVCAGESASWQSTTDLLRAALRIAVER